MTVKKATQRFDELVEGFREFQKEVLEMSDDEQDDFLDKRSTVMIFSNLDTKITGALFMARKNMVNRLLEGAKRRFEESNKENEKNIESSFEELFDLLKKIINKD